MIEVAKKVDLPLSYNLKSMIASATSGLPKLATYAIHVYFPTSFSETFAMCREKFPRLLGRNMSVTFLLVFSCTSLPLNFHDTMVSMRFTLRPRHVKVALEPPLVTTLRWTGRNTGMMPSTPAKPREKRKCDDQFDPLSC